VIEGLYFEEHGPADGPPVILSAGLGGSGAYWAPNLEALVGRYRVILYDHRGTGRSDRSLPANLTVDDMADDVIRVMDGLGLASAALVGHAAGGAIGLSVALRYPERLARLVVVNGWSAPDPHFLRCFEIRLALLRDSGVRAYIRAQPIFLYPSRWISENGARIDAEEAHQLEHFQGEANLEARIRALCAFDIDARLHKIRTPTFLIAAEDDMLVPPSCTEHMVGRLSGIPARMLSGGHACNVTYPESFNSILLAGLGATHSEGAS
jgi:aminoacrylate hydrolase